MELIDDLRESLAPESMGGDTTMHRCVDCLTEYDERKGICPKCGSEEFKLA